MQILIADDSPMFQTLLQTNLSKWGYDVITTTNGTDAWQLLQQPDAPQLAILDWVMPGMDGPDICQHLRTRENAPYTYVVLLTAKNHTQDIVYAMNSGADDVIMKPFNPEELHVRIRAGERILDLQARLVAAHDSLKHQAMHDPLTGLWNHGAVMELLAREIDRSARTQQPFGLIMADIDHFKRINDTYGHLAGNVVLQEVAKRLCTTTTRKYDTVSRYGGEEFLILTPYCNQLRAVEIAERIRTTISETPFPSPHGLIPLTMSLGVAASTPHGTHSATQLIHAADQALYQAKHNGRNTVVLANNEKKMTLRETPLKKEISETCA